VLKEGKMFAYFVSNPDSAYYKSDAFGKVLHYIQYFNADCKLRDRQGKRSLLIEKVTSIEKVYDILQMMKEG
jgi:transcription-repair coupling factor (superfamily II helicase)